MKCDLDFIVIGAQKSGTTSLFEYLRRHPQLCLPAAKELPYFSHEARYGQEWTQYIRKAFAFADPECRWGTVTPQYMYGGTIGGPLQPDGSPAQSDVFIVPRRIRERLPDVRMIAILRDPVQRARSHHAMANLNGWDTRSFGQAVQELLRPDALVSARQVASETTGYIVWGEYARILEGYLETFSRRQLLVLFTSELRSNPQLVLRRVFEFLSVDSQFVPDNVGVNYREGAAARRVRWLDLNVLQTGAASNTLARRVWHALPERARRHVDTRYDRLNYALRLWNRRGSARSAEPDADTDRLLCDHYVADAERLAELFDVTAPWAARAASSSVAPGHGRVPSPPGQRHVGASAIPSEDS